MLKNSLKIALRNLKRYSANSFISVMGLTVGMTSCMLLVLYVNDELGYDRFHENADRVFRVVTDVINNDETTHTNTSSNILIFLCLQVNIDLWSFFIFQSVALKFITVLLIFFETTKESAYYSLSRSFGSFVLWNAGWTFFFISNK